MQKQHFLTLVLFSLATQAQTEYYHIDRLPFEGIQICTQNGTSKDNPSHGIDKPSTNYDLDFGLSAGTKVLAAKDGYAVHTSDPIWGEVVRVYHGPFIPKKDENGKLLDRGIFTIYAHLSKVYVTKKSTGTWVKAGDVIGLSGNSGSSSEGAHLHFGVHKFSDYFAGKSIPMSIEVNEYNTSNDSVFVRKAKLLTGEQETVIDGPAGKRKGFYCKNEPKGWLIKHAKDNHVNAGNGYSSAQIEKDVDLACPNAMSVWESICGTDDVCYIGSHTFSDGKTVGWYPAGDCSDAVTWFEVAGDDFTCNSEPLKEIDLGEACICK